MAIVKTPSLLFTGETFSLNTDLSQPISAMLKKAPFNDVDARIDDETFPHQGRGGCQTLFGFVEVSQVWECNPAINNLERRGLFMAFPEELISLCSQRDERENVRDAPIVALGRGDWGKSHSPFVYARLRGDTFRLGTFSGPLTPGTRILVVCQRTSF